MKRTLYSLVAVAGIATLASCSDEKETLIVDGNEATVTFSAELPSKMQSRSFSDGKTATKLTYAVYEQGSTTPIIQDQTDFTGLKAQVSVQLITGKEYDFVFWAQDPNTDYFKVEMDGQTVSINYKDAKASDESLDAFFNSDSFKVTGNMSHTVELRRPFAQINVGTDDLTATALEGKKVTAGMTVKKAYTAFNLMTGKVDENTLTDITFAVADLPSKDETFPVQGYTYLEMGYVLVGDKTTADIELNFEVNGTQYNDITVTYAPLQRNYRTNIYGSLLTSSVLFNVEIKPEYYTPDYAVEVANVATAQELIAAITAGADNIIVEADVTIDLANETSDQVKIADGTVMTIDGKIITGTNQLVVPAGATVTVSGEGEVYANDRGGFQVLDGATLNASGITITSNNNAAGAAIYTENAEALNLEDVTINTAYRGIDGRSVKTISANNVTINSTASVLDMATNGGVTPAYAFKVWNGCVATLENVTINAIHGCLSVLGEGSVATLTNCNFKTENTAGATDAYYTVYVCDNAIVNIKSGNYSSPRYAVVLDDDDQTGLTYGTVNIYGGMFSQKAYNMMTKEEVAPATGYEYQATGDNAYPWTVVAAQ
ncbi:MAG: hypothetical protein LUD17_13295 [Bacteroidales bacterium]|nr:hypothetical protein [Bacteroidales bacterium]